MSRPQIPKSVIEVIAEAMPFEFLRAQADLTVPNNKAKSAEDSRPRTPKGLFIHYGIREHGNVRGAERIYRHAASAPNGATFLVFPTTASGDRLAALMGTGVVYVMNPRFDRAPARTGRPTSRSSISRRLRAIPNMRVFRPCIPSRWQNAGRSR